LAVNRMGKNSTSRFCDCLACAQAGVRPGIVVKEKDVSPVLVGTNLTDALSHNRGVLTRRSAVTAVAGRPRRGLSPICVLHNS
jgi:hypothetical protein